jgi:hypothetical protein
MDRAQQISCLAVHDCVVASRVVVHHVHDLETLARQQDLLVRQHRGLRVCPRDVEHDLGVARLRTPDRCAHDLQREARRVDKLPGLTVTRVS